MQYLVFLFEISHFTAKLMELIFEISCCCVHNEYFWFNWGVKHVVRAVHDWDCAKVVLFFEIELSLCYGKWQRYFWALGDVSNIDKTS